MAGVASLTEMAQAQTAICYNCPPEWADWAAQIKAIKDRLGITVPFDNKNSGQSLAQMLAERASPVADVAYLGVTFGIQAKKEGITASYRPAKAEDIPAGLKDPDGAGSPFIREPWACWSMSMRSVANRSRNPGPTS